MDSKARKTHWRLEDWQILAKWQGSGVKNWPSHCAVDLNRSERAVCLMLERMAYWKVTANDMIERCSDGKAHPLPGVPVASLLESVTVPASPVNQIASDSERLDRIEQAVNAICVDLNIRV